MNKKWCYLVFEIENDEQSGVNKKIYGQLAAIQQITGDGGLVFYKNKKIVYINRTKKEVIETSNPLENLKKILCQYDVFYLRWCGNSREFNRTLRWLHFMKKKVVVEIPTFPIMKEYFLKGKGRIKQGHLIKGIKSYLFGLYSEFIVLNFQKKYVDGFVYISTQQRVKKTRGVTIENGIDTNEIAVTNHIKRENEIVLISVANIRMYHGLDRVIEGIKQYSGNIDIKLYIVGEGEGKGNLINIVTDELKDKVFFVGKKFGKDLDDLFNIADIGVDALAVSRSGLRCFSSLKSREYMARGIPMLSIERNEMDSDIEDYVLYVTDNNSIIDMEEVVEFWRKMDYNKATSELRKCAEERFSWKIQMKKVIEALDNDFEVKNA